MLVGHCARVEMVNKFLTTTYFREFTRRGVVTIIRLTISGLHSLLHIHSLVLSQGRVQVNIHLRLIYKVLANLRDSAFLHVAI